jgi:hypothetical protein
VSRCRWFFDAKWCTRLNLSNLNVVADCLSRIDWQAVKQEEAETSQTQAYAPTVATTAPYKERTCIEFDVEDGTPFVCPVLTAVWRTYQNTFDRPTPVCYWCSVDIFRPAAPVVE